MAGNSNRQAGVCYVKANGQQFDIAGSFKCVPSTEKRTPLIANNGRVVGYKVEPSAPFIEGEVYLAGVDIRALAAFDNGTVTAEMADGTTYVLQQAWCDGQVEHDGIEGKTPVHWDGRAMDVIPAP